MSRTFVFWLSNQLGSRGVFEFNWPVLRNVLYFSNNYKKNIHLPQPGKRSMIYSPAVSNLSYIIWWIARHSITEEALQKTVNLPKNRLANWWSEKIRCPVLYIIALYVKLYLSSGVLMWINNHFTRCREFVTFSNEAFNSIMDANWHRL